MAKDYIFFYFLTFICFSKLFKKKSCNYHQNNEFISKKKSGSHVKDSFLNTFLLVCSALRVM